MPTYPMIILSGCPRSGTTLLNRILNNHPDIRMTFEFHAFLNLNRSLPAYLWHLRRGIKQRNLREPGESHRRQMFETSIFLTRFFAALLPSWNKTITGEIVAQALHRALPDVQYVGDKYPEYYTKLDSLSKIDGAYNVVIYRDPRDVVRSTLQNVQTKWRNKKYITRMDTVEKICNNWREAIAAMERNPVHAVRYEALVSQPEETLKTLADYLKLDAAGFKHRQIKNDSIGKYQSGLSTEQIAEIESRLGDEMRRLNYL